MTADQELDPGCVGLDARGRRAWHRWCHHTEQNHPARTSRSTSTTAFRAILTGARTASMSGRWGSGWWRAPASPTTAPSRRVGVRPHAPSTPAPGPFLPVLAGALVLPSGADLPDPA